MGEGKPFPGISHTVRDLLLASGDDTVVRCSREDKSVELRRRAARTQTQTLTPSRRWFEETGAASSSANKHAPILQSEKQPRYQMTPDDLKLAVACQKVARTPREADA